MTRYTYAGNQTAVTDPAGKWKTSVTDAFGNLIQVIEPDSLVTYYTYNAVNQLAQVSMPHSTGTQTRTFAYTGTDLTSATNPENGTVTYQYDGSHHVTKRTDAMGQETRYSYDNYGRLTQVQHWSGSPLQEQTFQRVTYAYDSNPLDGNYSQNAWGRLAAVQFNSSGRGLFYEYSYNQAGRVTAQHMDYYGGTQTFDAGYTWDTEGRMTGINYGPSYSLQYDGNGRLSGMNGTDVTATYDAGTGLMTGLNYFGFNETMQYNSLMQMTHQTVSNGMTPVMDMQYNFTAGQNNGRIASSVDGIAGETVNYGYDSLNRLTSAVASTWGQGFQYDGFGNLTNKTALVGSVPVLSVSFDAATNHQVGVTYDANGNPSGYGAAYDIENRMTSPPYIVEGYSYDPAGKRVMKEMIVRDRVVLLRDRRAEVADEVL